MVWKAQLIGSTAVSWWVDVEYATEYTTSGSWTSSPFTTGTKVGKVRPSWVADIPASSTVQVQVSNDNGSSWLPALNNQEVSFPSTESGDTIRYAVTMTTTDNETAAYTVSETARTVTEAGGTLSLIHI